MCCYGEPLKILFLNPLNAFHAASLFLHPLFLERHHWHEMGQRWYSHYKETSPMIYFANLLNGFYMIGIFLFLYKLNCHIWLLIPEKTCSKNCFKKFSPCVCLKLTISQLHLDAFIVSTDNSERFRHFFPISSLFFVFCFLTTIRFQAFGKDNKLNSVCVLLCNTSNIMKIHFMWKSDQATGLHAFL